MTEQRWYKVSDATFRHLNSLVTPGHRLTPGHRFNKDGTVCFPLEPDTAERLETHRQPHETDDQLLHRVLGGLVQ